MQTDPNHAPNELAELLRRAAQLAAERGVELDTYMNAAWSTYVDARPGLREQLEQARLTAELAGLRKLGKVGQA